MKINSINTLMKYMLDDNKWHVYRGQREANWPLESTMTRSLKLNPRISRFGASAERYTISQFKKNAHLYDESFNQYKGSDFAILTYIQHHGAPTRLLDFTTSKFIALFFAFDGIDLSSGGKYVRIWYFDKRELEKKTAEISGVSGGTILSIDPDEIWKDYISKNASDALFAMTPPINSMRSHIQNGHFLCPGNIQMSIQEIYEKDYKNILGFVDINKSLYESVFEMLRKVNICHGTLYGGVDSFSKDIKNRLATIK